MYLLDLIMFLFSLSVVLTAFIVVWKLRGFRTRLIRQRRGSIQSVFAAIGEIESLREAKRRAIEIGEIMRQNELVALIIPLKSGGKVSFRVD